MNTLVLGKKVIITKKQPFEQRLGKKVIIRKKIKTKNKICSYTV